MLPTKVLSCGAAGREPRSLVATPDHDVGRRLDLGDLVAVDQLAIAGEIEHLATRRRETPGRWRTARRCPGRRRPARPSRRRRFRWALPVGPISTTGSPGSSSAHKIGRAAHLEHDGRNQALLAVDPGAGQRQALHGEPRSVDLGGQRLEVLQAVELPRREAARGRRRVHDDFDDGRRQPHDLAHGGAQLAVDAGEESRRRPAARPPALRASMRLTIG